MGSGLEYPAQPTLFIEFHGSEGEVESQVEVLRSLSEEEGAGELQWAEKQEDRTRLWTARHKAYYAALALRHGCRAVVTDVCVPTTVLPEMVLRAKEDIRAHNLVGPMMGHVGDGNFHTIHLFDPNNSEELNTCKKVAERMGRLAIELGGTCTGEHGVGLGKKNLLVEQFGQEGVETMRRIKRALDPQGIMNPGKIIDV